MGVKDENREIHAKSRSRLKVLSVGELTISIGSLFYEMGSLTEKAAFLRSKRKLRWRNQDMLMEETHNGELAVQVVVPALIDQRN